MLIILLLFSVLCSLISTPYVSGNLAVKMETKNCECGTEMTEREGSVMQDVRVIGGEETKKHEFPWQVALLLNQKLSCGGSLINDRYILTAAHCFKTINYPEPKVVVFPKSNISFVLGEHDLQIGEATNVVRYPEKIILHSFYNPLTYFCDIALARMDKPFEDYTFEIMPICLPPPNFEYPEKGTVSGWGSTVEGGRASQILMKADVEFIEGEMCKERLSDYGFNPDVMLCAASEGKDACQGDSGGPLAIEGNNGTYYQVGVVSFGVGCGNLTLPGIYTKVEKFTNWIMFHSQDGIYCKKETKKDKTRKMEMIEREAEIRMMKYNRRRNRKQRRRNRVRKNKRISSHT